MVYRGIVQGDVVVLPAGVHLPEGLLVTVATEGAVALPSPVSNGHTLRNGVPVFPTNYSGLSPGLEQVNALRDELP